MKCGWRKKKEENWQGNVINEMRKRTREGKSMEGWEEDRKEFFEKRNWSIKMVEKLRKEEKMKKEEYRRGKRDNKRRRDGRK